MSFSRHNPVKLRRFCQYIQATDFRKIADTAQDDTAPSEFLLSDKTESKNLNAAINFLHFLDPSGFLSSVADPTKTSPIIDESLVERNQRIVIASFMILRNYLLKYFIKILFFFFKDALTQGMDVEQYLDYTKVTCLFTLMHKYQKSILYFLIPLFRKNAYRSREGNR